MTQLYRLTPFRYFGLQYTDSLGTDAWLSMEKKVTDQKVTLFLVSPCF